MKSASAILTPCAKPYKARWTKYTLLEPSKVRPLTTTSHRTKYLAFPTHLHQYNVRDRLKEMIRRTKNLSAGYSLSNILRENPISTAASLFHDQLNPLIQLSPTGASTSTNRSTTSSSANPPSPAPSTSCNPATKFHLEPVQTTPIHLHPRPPARLPPRQPPNPTSPSRPPYTSSHLHVRHRRHNLAFSTHLLPHPKSQTSSTVRV